MPHSQIRPYESLNVLTKKSRPAGSVAHYIHVQANSILSDLVIDQIAGGSVDVVYEQVLSAEEMKPLKTVSFNSVGVHEFWTHPFHNSIRITITTTASTTYTLRMTGRTDAEVLRATFFDQTVFDLEDHKGLPALCLDDDEQKLFILRCKNGALITDPIDTGSPVYINGEETSTPNVLLQLAQFTVGAGLERRLGSITVSSSIGGNWAADDGATTIASGRLAPGHPESTFTFAPRKILTAGTTFTLNFTGRAPATAVNYHLQMSEV